MSEDEFVHNPFLQLDGAAYPSLNIKNSSGTGNHDSLEEEKEFFKNNVDKFKQPGLKKKTGFTLADLGAEIKYQGISSRNNAKDKPVLPVKPQKEAKEKIQLEENEHFIWAMRDTQPLKPGGRMVKPGKSLKTFPQKEENFEEMLQDKLEFALLNADEYIEGYVKNLDESVLNKLRAGQYGVEAHLDLHGLNSIQAFESMRNFIKNCWFKGMRTILLVPGRGLNSPNGHGILKQKIPQWLTHEPFKGVTLAFCTARPQDGGPGSIYVLLRVNRKKGRIYWERLPPDPDLYI